MKQQRPDGPTFDRLAICQACDRFEPRRIAAIEGDGHCAALSCRLGRRGLVAYIRDRRSTCPLRRWREAFRRREAGD